MEEYRDLELTLQSFMRVLDEAEFRSIDAGIVLQAYLPDSHDALERLGAWAIARREAGGGKVKVRIVKGANLAMEHAEAELHGWTPAPYPTKADVDASYKAMLDSALRPEWSHALRIGLASHNLFDIAWAFVLGRDRGALDRIEFEMLEGMAPSQARSVQELAGGLLMYAPVVADDDFDASIAYLTRRLDENTQPENFLRSLFTLVPDSPLFDQEVDRFRTAVQSRHTISRARRRALPDPVRNSTFANASESDFTDAATRASIAEAVAAPPLPTFETIETEQRIDDIVSTAVVAFGHTDHDPDLRRAWLLDVADLMDAERFQTIGLLAHAVSKTAHEADPEIAEAIDFCRYYATAGRASLDNARAAGLDVSGRGVITVIGPWNFPYAIPTGGVAASIAAGNSVILKPAPEAVEVGAWIADQFWRAGVPNDVLQLVVCDDGPVGTHLVTHDDVDTVVLTGSYDTASMFLSWKPTMRLFAETSGKDALVITPSADLDQAIGDLVRSAFGHAGQKCSAASLGIVVGELYDDASFQQRLRDAVSSLRVGASTDAASMVGPLVQAPAGSLERALTTLDDGETWLVEPACLDADSEGRLWSPGVRLGVAEGSWFHRTECFGPVLGIMRADDLDHALRLQNATPFGLTGGIHTLDDDEIELWMRRVQIGNAYINRHITGAIVQRQPFGGWKRSAVGGGAKAGGPGYVAQFARVAAGDAPADRARRSFEAAWRETFSASNDPTGLAVESNTLRYVPLDRVAVRHDGHSGDALALVRLAAETVGVELTASEVGTETDLDFAERVARLGVDRVRLLSPLDPAARTVLHEANIPIDDAAPVDDGHLELQHWVKEQAVSRTMHRHGRLLR
jgi:RHH-type proline utilization regulon transcriptional repressor/proline dehydrogenase/delta 1-pyrroline-5-carboxylate dehydrogenase